MLSALAVRDFVIVESLDLEIDRGMTVLTGETGAGKSIMVDALSLALGGRTSGDLVRAGAERAEVAAEFVVAADSPAAAWLAAQELDDEGQCVLRRSWSRDGRSRAFVNGRPVAAQNLRELADLLVDIHGQHAHQQLLSRDAHRRLLDEYAGNDSLLDECEAAYRHLRSAQQRLQALRGESDADGAARIELLRYQLAELEELAPADGEYEQLHAEHQRLSRGTELVEACGRALHLLDDDETSARQLLRAAHRALASFTAIAPSLTGVLASLETARIGLDEAVAELGSLSADLEPDPERLLVVEQRLERMHELARKHRRGNAELPEVMRELSTTLASLESTGDRAAALEREISRLSAIHAGLCEALSARRSEAADPLARAVSDGIRELGMPGARFEISVQPDAGHAAAHGHDRVEFLVATNPGQAPALLSRIASGGELSRIGLVLETVSQRGSGVGTLIFDEVDAGIGGEVAGVVGRLMQRLSARCQVLCVTHLPQVASLADHHIHVAKHTGRDSAVATLEPITGDRRIEEIARMLSGSRITQRTLAHARELLEAD